MWKIWCGRVLALLHRLPFLMAYSAYQLVNLVLKRGGSRVLKFFKWPFIRLYKKLFLSPKFSFIRPSLYPNPQDWRICGIRRHAASPLLAVSSSHPQRTVSVLVVKEFPMEFKNSLGSSQGSLTLFPLSNCVMFRPIRYSYRLMF